MASPAKIDEGRRNYNFRIRTIQKLKKLKESGYFKNETDIVESAIDYLYEAVQSGEFTDEGRKDIIE